MKQNLDDFNGNLNIINYLNSFMGHLNIVVNNCYIDSFFSLNKLFELFNTISLKTSVLNDYNRYLLNFINNFNLKSVKCLNMDITNKDDDKYFNINSNDDKLNIFQINECMLPSNVYTQNVYNNPNSINLLKDDLINNFVCYVSHKSFINVNKLSGKFFSI